MSGPKLIPVIQAGEGSVDTANTHIAFARDQISGVGILGRGCLHPLFT